jgi:branched-chain amino acid transport system substrate-binding protein
MIKRICLVSALTIFVCVSLASAADSVKIGFLYTFSGRLSGHGNLARQGAELAIKQVNDAGGINGKTVVGVFQDDASDPKQGAAKARELSEKEKVDVLMGVSQSDMALEVSQVANQAKVPFIITNAQAPAATGSKCNPYTFRVYRTSDGMMRSAAAVATQLNANVWTTVGPDYSFGYQCWDEFKKRLTQKKPNVTYVAGDKLAYGSLKNDDWTSQIKKVKDSGADGVVITLYAGNLIDFLKQSAKEGLFDGKRSVIAPVGSLTTLVALGIEMPKGVWMTPAYWFQGQGGAANDAFVKAYQERYNTLPDYQAAFSFAGVKAYCLAASRAGSQDRKAIVAALEGLEIDLPMGPMVIRKEDHQASFAMYAGVTGDLVAMVESGTRKIPCRLLEGGKVLPADQVTPNPEETGCTMTKP